MAPRWCEGMPSPHQLPLRLQVHGLQMTTTYRERHLVAHVERPEVRRREGEVTFQCKRSFGFIGLDEAALPLTIWKHEDPARKTTERLLRLRLLLLPTSTSSSPPALPSSVFQRAGCEEGERGSVDAISRSSCKRRHHEGGLGWVLAGWLVGRLVVFSF